MKKTYKIFGLIFSLMILVPSCTEVELLEPQINLGTKATSTANHEGSKDAKVARRKTLRGNCLKCPIQFPFFVALRAPSCLRGKQ